MKKGRNFAWVFRKDFPEKQRDLRDKFRILCIKTKKKEKQNSVLDQTYMIRRSENICVTELGNHKLSTMIKEKSIGRDRSVFKMVLGIDFKKLGWEAKEYGLCYMRRKEREKQI